MRIPQTLAVLLANPVTGALAHPGHAVDAQPGLAHLVLLHVLPLAVALALAGAVWVLRPGARYGRQAARHIRHRGKERRP